MFHLFNPKNKVPLLPQEVDHYTRRRIASLAVAHTPLIPPSQNG